MFLGPSSKHLGSGSLGNREKDTMSLLWRMNSKIKLFTNFLKCLSEAMLPWHMRNPVLSKKFSKVQKVPVEGLESPLTNPPWWWQFSYLPWPSRTNASNFWIISLQSILIVWLAGWWHSSYVLPGSESWFLDILAPLGKSWECKSARHSFHNWMDRQKMAVMGRAGEAQEARQQPPLSLQD